MFAWRGGFLSGNFNIRLISGLFFKLLTLFLLSRSEVRRRRPTRPRFRRSRRCTGSAAFAAAPTRRRRRLAADARPAAPRRFAEHRRRRWSAAPPCGRPLCAERSQEERRRTSNRISHCFGKFFLVALARVRRNVVTRVYQRELEINPYRIPGYEFLSDAAPRAMSRPCTSSSALGPT